ncbi:polysaccharide pyruvyl transferase family protein [Bacillus cereus]|uniref:Polysaccharide pyruvyl transferase domain-containing protein n=1 Tax=Bacillus cereus TaxID=1396 RepID=A0AA44QBD4_BACCE|nr:polysaccharide pyruvyl transferase family protein [Bacillus cereus]PFN07054.1 hypothetical protein COJ55_11960 [Bacillus cereus]PFS02792.1 hypothetical protein COK38_08625 [Bacillus cereus]PGZ12842.1 hypothetical protein COE46_22620 [Bacillus cereus]
MKKDLVLMGAFDRYNYGDLLFPIFIQEYIEKYRPDVKDYYSQIVPVALEEKDLRNVGGLSTKSWKKLDVEVSKDLVVVGGDVLGASIEQMYMDSLNSFYSLFVARAFRKLTSNKYIVKKSRSKFGMQNAFPYVPIASQNGIDKVVYNAVSGSGFIRDDFQEETKNTLLKRLSDSHFISIRDEKTLANLRNNHIDAVLAPDSACIMAELYPLNQLERKVSNEKIRELKEKKYIVFQFGYWHIRQRIDDVIEQIEEIATQTEDEIVLLPVGFATNHDDLIALEKISQKLKIKHTLFNDLTIWDIMYVIGNAGFFFGTSLHGNITAMAYGVPCVGVCKRVVKLDKYLSTWGIAPFNKNIEIEDIAAFYFSNKSFDRKDLKKNADRLIKLVHKNYDVLLNRLISNS